MDDVQEMYYSLMTVVNGIERVKRQGQSGNLMLLQAVAAHDQVRPSELSIELGLHQSSITRQVQGLHAAGYVDVLPDPSDGRSCFVRLTDTGREELLRLTQYGLARFAAFVENWNADDVRTLARLLTKLDRSKADANRRRAFGTRRMHVKAAHSG
jgi:DNA-binding MarR family transcriptional regulator